MIQQYQRQVHLDFHTSPHIMDVGEGFDAEQFAERFVEAHINSVTVFAKCHHGMCYYPTKTGIEHPALNGRDLLGEQIEALHRRGIRCPIYTPVAWEEDVAHRFPQWRQLKANGIAGRSKSADLNAEDQVPAGWWFNNFIDPGYQDYIEAHLREFMKRYEVDGVFFDILFYAQGCCWSEPSIRFREKHGLLEDTLENNKKFEALAQEAFMKKMNAIVKGINPKASIFYNNPFHAYVDGRYGMSSLAPLQTHLELESLPSGYWGYHHFPKLARQMLSIGKDWLGMTGRFQKMWGDFGGIKPQPALEYECFRSQAMGGGNSIGDQLSPRGEIDEGAYQLIGNVYKQTAEAEPFYEGSSAVPQIGVLVAGHPSLSGNVTSLSEEGIACLCAENHYDYALLRDDCDLSNYELIVLPDYVRITDVLLEKLRKHYDQGGKLLLSYKSGLDEAGNWALDFLPLEIKGKESYIPTYWRANKEIGGESAEQDRVFYRQGLQVEPKFDSEVLVERVYPYFNRTDVTYCSHFQAPPVKEACLYPAVIKGERCVYFADPIFHEVRQSGNQAVKEIWLNVMEMLIGNPLVGKGLPTTVECYPRRQGMDLLITLLHYIPVRKALEIDVIEDRMPLGDYQLQFSGKVEKVYSWPESQELEKKEDDSFVLPKAYGRLLLKVPDYYLAY